MRTVRDIMNPDLVSVRTGTSVQELVHLLDEAGVSGVPVLDPAGRVAGVVSRTDVIRHAAREPEVPAADVFWETVAGRSDEDDAEEVYFLAPETSVMMLPARGMPGLGLDDVTVDDIMTHVAFSVDPDMLVWELADFLVRGRVHRALVLEDGRLVGIVTAFDVLRVMAGDAGK